MVENTAAGKTWIGLCESQPATAEGVRLHLQQTQDLDCRWSVGHLGVGLQLARQQPIALLVVDKAFGHIAITEALDDLRSFAPDVPVAVWGSTLSEPEALRLLQSGVRGVLRKTAPLPTITDCFRSLLQGGSWLGDILPPEDPLRETRSGLTLREREVLELVQRGFKNKEIAASLGIRPGTVKIHLKHIFEKTGVHGRYGLALNGMRKRGLLSEQAVQLGSSV